MCSQWRREDRKQCDLFDQLHLFQDLRRRSGRHRGRVQVVGVWSQQFTNPSNVTGLYRFSKIVNRRLSECFLLQLRPELSAGPTGRGSNGRSLRSCGFEEATTFELRHGQVDQSSRIMRLPVQRPAICTNSIFWTTTICQDCTKHVPPGGKPPRSTKIAVVLWSQQGRSKSRCNRLLALQQLEQAQGHGDIGTGSGGPALLASQTDESLLQCLLRRTWMCCRNPLLQALSDFCLRILCCFV
mmetsp:Transcript_7894/g.16809  ORF Transcript_7894/g.16809 Transcript_7894/m.16809 type:complete len:241 (-) Transcript_7894:934-1656(-)